MNCLVRNYRKGEKLPERLVTGFESAEKTDCEWIFLAERDEVPVALLVMAPAHGVVILLRLLATEQAQQNDVRSLLLGALATARARGYLGYLTWLNPTNQVESALLAIIRLGGGTQITQPQVACGGKL